jgi:choline dehydrogenase-like flavoprotein
MSRDVVDAVIVGAGASGGVLAKRLSEAGLRVVVFERGPEINPEDYALHDELTSQVAGMVRSPVCGEEKFGPREFRYTDGEPFRRVEPGDWEFSSSAAVVGGGQLLYGALMWRRPPVDFRMRTEYGSVEGSTLEDWPLTYDDLEPFFTKAEYELGVCGEGGVNPFEGKRSRPYPMPPIDIHPGDEMIRDAAKRKGYHPFVVPLGLLTDHYRGRSSCIAHPCCNGFICEIGAKSTPVTALFPPALATGNCRIVANSIVSEITLDSRGKPNGVAYFDPEGRARHQSARIVVVACSGIETPRLLLNSKSKWFPRGLGNGNDWVGRNVMGHISPWVWGVMDRVTNLGYGPGPGIAVDDFHAHNPGIVGGSVIYSRTETTPISFANRRPRGAPRWGRAHKEYQRLNFRRYIRLFAPAEDMPRFENRVEVSDGVRDRWGIPVARMTHSYHPNDLEVWRFFRDKMIDLLEEAGARDITPSNVGRGGIGYQLGSCRMGADPTTSVVNSFGQSHEVDNLFVVDGSVFVTSGGRNPALTIQALAYRFADHLIDQWEGGAWRNGTREV